MTNKIILRTLSTEKSSRLLNNNIYVFTVLKEINKIELKKYIQSQYNVDVLQINMLNTSKKPIKRGKIKGFTKSRKKAFVKIKQGQKLEIKD